MGSGRKLLCILLALLLVACSGEPRPVTPPGPFGGHGAIPVFVVNHGWHTGVMVDAASAQQRIPQLAQRFPGVAWLEFGWGNRDFYEADEAGVLLALRAIFPGETVVHVVGLYEKPFDYLGSAGAARLCIDEAQLAALLDFLAASFEFTPSGEPLPRGRAHAMSQFYNGAGSYHLANTCNVWTARALQSLGMELSSGGKLTAGSVMKYLERHPSVEVLSRVEQPAALSASALSCP